MITIRPYIATDQKAWDQYVENHPQGTIFHLTKWKNVIEKTYGHKAYYLIATKNTQKTENRSQRPEIRDQKSEIRSQKSENRGQRAENRSQKRSFSYELSAMSHACPVKREAYFTGELNIVGILPLVHLKHFLFGNSLISIPFFDMGGILADNDEIEKALLYEAIKLGKKLKAQNIELRHTEPLPWLADSSKLLAHCPPSFPISHELSTMSYVTKSHKVRMLLKLPESSEILMKSFKAKLRSQIKKPMKDGLTVQVGQTEYLEEFYDIFCVNMRDLGSPVHSIKLIENVLCEFKDRARIFLVHKNGMPLAGSVVLGFKDVLENPWASSLKEFQRLNPNMLLYWTMLEYACDHGYSAFDFGRSSPDEGTYKFKKQWGARPETLHWQYISLNGHIFDQETPEKSSFAIAIQYWKKLPVHITRIIGPYVRKHIGL